MALLSSIYYFFAPYTDPLERSVGLFFKSLTEHSDRAKTRNHLHKLIRRDIAVINLWSEYRYKGYKYLRKSNRKKLYRNLQLIADDFETFRAKNERDSETVQSIIHTATPQAEVEQKRAILIQAMMDYFSSSQGVYEYRESSSFGRMLRDPRREKLIGDCNQIVTLYIYLYSRYFDVRDLEIRLLPGHVALHLDAVDIETTSGKFADYSNQRDSKLMPIEEIVSVNLLDTTDSYLSTHEVSSEDFLQASRFAFILSHEREIVSRNLDAAYANLINLLMSRHNYTAALKFAQASRNVELIAVVGHNGAIHNMQQHKFAAARRFAQHALKRRDLIRETYHAEGLYHYKLHQYRDAIKAFKQYGDQALVKQCYEALYFEEQKKLESNLTSESIKRHTSTVKAMHNFAKKSGNNKLIQHTNNLLKYL